MKVSFLVVNSNSLKAKRRILLSLRDLLRRKFNISLSEIGCQDKWQRSVFAIACLGTNRSFVDRAVAKIVDFIRDFNGIELLDYEVEMI